MGLREDPNLPIVGIVSRLVAHKGLDLVCEVLQDMMELPCNLWCWAAATGYEEFFRRTAGAVSRPYGCASGQV